MLFTRCPSKQVDMESCEILTYVAIGCVVEEHTSVSNIISWYCCSHCLWLVGLCVWVVLRLMFGCGMFHVLCQWLQTRVLVFCMQWHCVVQVLKIVVFKNINLLLIFIYIFYDILLQVVTDFRRKLIRKTKKIIQISSYTSITGSNAF